jgi:hypothetical protein
MEEVLEHLHGLAHDGVGLPAFDVHDETDTTGIVLVSGIIETLGLWHPVRRRR